jgi:hypothetical protein
VDAPDGGLVHCPPAPGASLRVLRTSWLLYPRQRGAPSPWAPTLRNLYGVRSPSRLVARRTHAPSGSCGGAGAGVPRALPRHAPAAAFAAVHQSRALTTPNRHPAGRIIRFSSLPSLLCLCLSARVSVVATGNTTPISHLPCPAAFASTPNPACLRGARSRVPPSIRPQRSILKSQRTRACRLHGVARSAAAGRGRREEGRGGRGG